MDKIQLIVIVLLALTSCMEASIVIENKSLKHFPRQDLDTLGLELVKWKKSKYNATIGYRKLKLIETGFNGAKGNPNPARILPGKRNITFYFNDWSYGLNVSYIYEYSVLGFPFTGEMTVKFIYIPRESIGTSYRIQLDNDNKTFRGSLFGQMSFDLLHYDNPFIFVLGIRPVLITALLEASSNYTKKIEKDLAVCIPKRYEKFFGDHIKTIKFPNFDDYTVNITTKFSEAKINERPSLEFYYKDYIGTNELSNRLTTTFIEQDYSRKINYEYKILGAILAEPLSTIKDLKIKDEDIQEDSPFQLNKASLRFIFPSILFKPWTLTNLTMHFTNIQSSINSSNYINAQIIIYKNISFKFSLTGIINKSNTVLFDSTVSLDIFTKPRLNWNLATRTVNFNLGFVTANVHLNELHSIKDDLDIVNKYGIPNLLKLYINEHYMKNEYNRLMLGDGLNLAMIYDVGEDNKVILGPDSVEITLY